MKYRIQHADGHPIHPDAQYFVLRLDSDPHARVAAMAYAASVRHDNPQLAGELETWVARIIMFRTTLVKNRTGPAEADPEEGERSA
ncbi:MAG: hypothetical protein C4521_12355 [Actinobacteria bacterium]|nr:MAG: hypothetical protein C4521_12355 [Actinomycetota bacterium]